MVLFAAVMYTLLCVVLVGFQLMLTAGAPWGQLAMGGRWPGRFPPLLRLLALVQALMLAAMAGVMLDQGLDLSLTLPAWSATLVWVITLLTTVANCLTPSLPERRLWAPVTVLMLLCASAILFLNESRM